MSDAAIVGPAVGVSAVAIAEAVHAVFGASQRASVTRTVPMVAVEIDEPVVTIDGAFTVGKTSAPGTEIESGPGTQLAEMVSDVEVISA